MTLMCCCTTALWLFLCSGERTFVWVLTLLLTGGLTLKELRVSEPHLFALFILKSATHLQKQRVVKWTPVYPPSFFNNFQHVAILFSSIYPSPSYGPYSHPTIELFLNASQTLYFICIHFSMYLWNTRSFFLA